MMVKYQDVIQCHTMKKDDEFKIKKDESEELEDRLKEEIRNTIQSIHQTIKELKPSAEYRRITTVAAANSHLRHIMDEISNLGKFDLGKFDYEFIEATNRLMEDACVCAEILRKVDLDTRKECDPWKYDKKEE